MLCQMQDNISFHQLTQDQNIVAASTVIGTLKYKVLLEPFRYKF